jgi:hypothetical protein
LWLLRISDGRTVTSRRTVLISLVAFRERVSYEVRGANCVVIAVCGTGTGVQICTAEARQSLRFCCCTDMLSGCFSLQAKEKLDLDPLWTRLVRTLGKHYAKLLSFQVVVTWLPSTRKIRTLPALMYFQGTGGHSWVE